ncbi:MAG: hypothetical protein CMD23_00220 [Flavobacteriales bacterium]|nr:hypothetical protein [Flavobacteriales bacterium]
MLLKNRNFALQNGFLLGLLYCLVVLLFYFFNLEMLFSGWGFSLVFWGLFLLFPIYLLKTSEFVLHKFKDVFSVIFLGFVTATFLYSLFTWLLYSVVDPSVMQMYVELMLEKVNQNPDLYPKEMNEDYFMANFEFKNQINAYVFFLIPCVLYSALVALIVSTFKNKIKN